MDHDFDGYGDENRRIWEANARWWDDRIGDGNGFQDLLIQPASERLLEVRAGLTAHPGCAPARPGER